MTGLVAMVAMVVVTTNVTVANNAMGGCAVKGSGQIWTVCAVYGCDHHESIPATKEWRTTTVTETTTLKTQWNGKPVEVVTEKVLSKKVEERAIKKEWGQWKPSVPRQDLVLRLPGSFIFNAD